MKMQITYLVITATVLLGACQKIDTRYILKNLHKKNCDFIQANSEHIRDEYGSFPLFTKHYDAKTGRLNKIDVSFRNVVAPPSPTTPLYITYRGQDLILLRDNVDTVAILYFNSKGQLTNADAVPHILFSWEQKYNYRFLYSGSNLTAIQYWDYRDWSPYIELEYDNRKTNISKVYFQMVPGDNNNNIAYEYNYSKKAKGQYYPDEMFGDFHRFWYLIKYLNVIPGLQPDHLLTRTYFKTESYPGDIERKYSV